VQAKELPPLSLPNFEEGKISTRKASSKVLNAIAAQLPEIWGGSADLAGSNLTTIEGADSFLPENRATAEWSASANGRVLHFGVREHAMGGILNGIALEGLTRVFGGTFFVFSDYMRPSVRLAALMGLPVTYVWTHDSIGVGEDGPTHQPVEHLAVHRAIPNLAVVRPADANETAVVWEQLLRNTSQPTALVLSRQDLPIFPREGAFAPAAGAVKGGYVLRDANGGAPKVILIATGSEVELALAAQDELQAEGIPTRVVSMPCQEWFDAQEEPYRDHVLPPFVTARVSVEAGLALGWSKYVGANGKSISLEHYGASASGATLFQLYEITAQAVAQAARELLK
jgi:transketolase